MNEKKETGKSLTLTYKRAKPIIIGEASIEELQKAVKLEYDFGIRPLVAATGDNYKGNFRNNSMEYYASRLLIHSVLKANIGNIEKCPDNCRADLMFYNPNNLTKCLGIQIKTTNNIKEIKQPAGNITYAWQFSALHKNYDGLLIYMRSLMDGESWLIPYDKIKKYHKNAICLQISRSYDTRIDWKRYEVNNYNIAAKICEYYNSILYNVKSNLIFQTYDELSTPTCIEHQKEHKTRKSIMPVLLQMDLDIKTPELENMHHDLIIGDLKIQEKKAYPVEDRHKFSVNLYRNHNKSNMGGNPYNEKDFDILIIHNPEPYERSFYFIPMDKLIEHGYVETSTTVGKRNMSVYLKENRLNEQKHNWTVEFLCYYDDPNIAKRLLFIYDMQLNHDIKPIVVDNPIIWDKECKNIDMLITKWNLPRTHPLVNVVHHYLLCDKKIIEVALTWQLKSFRLPIHYFLDKARFIYNEHEFDYLYCKMPDDYNQMFYLIPASEMAKRKILRTPDYIGKKAISVPPPGSKFRPNKACHTWINDFIFCYDDENFDKTLANFFEKYPR